MFLLPFNFKNTGLFPNKGFFDSNIIGNNYEHSHTEAHKGKKTTDELRLVNNARKTEILPKYLCLSFYMSDSWLFDTLFKTVLIALQQNTKKNIIYSFFFFFFFFFINAYEGINSIKIVTYSLILLTSLAIYKEHPMGNPTAETANTRFFATKVAGAGKGNFQLLDTALQQCLPLSIAIKLFDFLNILKFNFSFK